jgi:hypothetical protein
MADVTLSMPVHGFVDCLVSLHECAAALPAGWARPAPRLIAVQHQTAYPCDAILRRSFFTSGGRFDAL